MSMNRYREALKVYEKATEIFYEDLGVTSIDKVMAKYRNLGGQLYYAASAMTGIKEVLQEEGPPAGAYCCSYPSFLDLYHVMVRMSERTGMEVTLMVCTMESDRNPDRDRRTGRWNYCGRCFYRESGRKMCIPVTVKISSWCFCWEQTKKMDG